MILRVHIYADLRFDQEYKSSELLALRHLLRFLHRLIARC